MNIYKIIAVIAVVFLLGYYFGAGQVLYVFVWWLVQMPSFENGITVGKVLDVGIRLAFLAVIFEFVKSMVKKS